MNESSILRRQQALQSVLVDLKLDALLVNPGPSLKYLTNLDFHLSERPVLAIFRPDGVPIVVLPELEEGKLRDAPFEVRSFTYGEDPATWQRAFKSAAAESRLDFRRVGVEPRRLRVLELRLIESAAPRAAYLNAEDAVARLRMQKDEAEIGRIRKAVQIAESALEQTLKGIQPGVTERELANELTIQMLRAGSAPELPFAPIVAFGEASANPHAVPSDRALKEGDLIIIDWGAAEPEGYLSDLTRTFHFGELDPELVEITRTVERANLAAQEAAGPGVPAQEVDRAARAVIETAGYGDRFIHRTGHGLGLEGHEEPYIRGDNPQILSPGMVFTIEPGIYLPGKGGARIEDDVVITANGCESLSRLERSLLDLADFASVRNQTV